MLRRCLKKTALSAILAGKIHIVKATPLEKLLSLTVAPASLKSMKPLGNILN